MTFDASYPHHQQHFTDYLVLSALTLMFGDRIDDCI